MSGRTAKRLRVTLAALIPQFRTRPTANRLKRAWRSLSGPARARLSALPAASEVASRLLVMSPEMANGGGAVRTGKKGGTGMLRPFPRSVVRGPKRHPWNRRGRR